MSNRTDFFLDSLSPSIERYKRASDNKVAVLVSGPDGAGWSSSVTHPDPDVLAELKRIAMMDKDIVEAFLGYLREKAIAKAEAKFHGLDGEAAEDLLGEIDEKKLNEVADQKFQAASVGSDDDFDFYFDIENVDVVWMDEGTKFVVLESHGKEILCIEDETSWESA